MKIYWDYKLAIFSCKAFLLWPLLKDLHMQYFAFIHWSFFKIGVWQNYKMIKKCISLCENRTLASNMTGKLPYLLYVCFVTSDYSNWQVTCLIWSGILIGKPQLSTENSHISECKESIWRTTNSHGQCSWW